jgi:phage FluMu gp28-like protein
MYQRLRAQRIAVDGTGLGDPVCELLYRNNLIVDPIHITAQSKAELIDRLSISLDRGEITIPRDEALIGELWDFQATERASGTDRLEASAGRHDDTVIALALAVHAMRSVPQGVPPLLPPLHEDDFQRSLRLDQIRDMREAAAREGDWIAMDGMPEAEWD